MDWADFRMRLFRIVSLDIFDARDDFISTPEGMDAKWFFYKYCGAAGLKSDRWQSLVTLAKNLLKVDEEGLADGAEIFETESSISIEELVSKYIFENE